MTAPLPPQSARTVRFRGSSASDRAQHLTGAAAVVVLALLSLAGLISALPALVFFAVGAGAGYSLSGSV